VIVVREAAPRDLEPLLELARALHEKSPRAWIPFDADGARELFAKSMLHKRFAPFVALVDERPVGFTVGCLQRWAYLRGTFVSDLVLFSGYPGAGRKLLARLVVWGREQGAHEAVFSVSYGRKSAHRAEPVYARQGLEFRGGIFAMNLRK
jgi:hypothetical protein